MVFLADHRELEVQVESTKGTQESVIWDGTVSQFRVLDARLAPAPEFDNRPVQRPGGSKLKKIRVGSPARLTFRLEARRSEAAGTADHWGDLLQACGYREVTNASTNQIYTPWSDQSEHETLSMWIATGDGGSAGIRHGLRGCAGDVNFIFEAGKLAYMEFDFLGIYTGTADAGLNSITHETGIPPVWGSPSTNMTYNAAEVVTTGITVRTGSRVVMRKDANAADGLKHAHVTGRDVTASMVVEAVAVATADYYGDMENENERAIAWSLGSTLAYSIPQGQILNVEEQDDDNDAMLGLEISCNENSEAGGDEWSITKT